VEAVRDTGGISRSAERQGVRFRIAWKKSRGIETRPRSAPLEEAAVPTVEETVEACRRLA
jgi:hypothetical protein